ncbi:MAG: cytochrome c-type biogenesis protein, partial [Paracoccaceae bacterium]
MFGIELIDASLLPAIAVALAAGILSFLSPCVLPIVPPYLAFMGGISIKDLSGEGEVRRSPIGAAVFFVMGLSTVFLLLGFTASAFGRFFLNYAETFNTVSGLIV